MSLTERISQIQEKEGYSASQFAEKLGIQRSGLSHIYSGRNKPSIGFIQKLINHFPHYNLEWILNGNLPILKSTAASPDETAEMPIKEPQNDLFTGVESESPASYQANPSTKHNGITDIKKNENDIKKTVKQIILVYEDDTFEILDSKNRK